MTSPKRNVLKQFYRVDEVAQILDISRATLYRRIQDGTIPSRTIRGTIRIPVDEFHEKFGGASSRR